MKSHKKYWSLTSQKYDEYVGSKGGNTHELLINPFVVELLGNLEGKVVLDAACGNGYFSAIMSKTATKVYGVDFTQELLNEANKKHKKENIEFIQASVENMPFKNEFFDIVMCSMALMDFSDLNSALKEISRVLKVGGYLVASITHPCFENPPFTDSIRNKNGVKQARIVKNYFQTGLIEDVENNYQHYHYTISDYVNSLSNNNLYLSQMVEPNDSLILKNNDYTPAPYYLIFRAKKGLA